MTITKKSHIYQLSQHYPHTNPRQHQDKEEISKDVVETGAEMTIGGGGG